MKSEYYFPKYSMGKSESLQVWAGGYDPRSIAGSALEEREPIAKQGTAVLWAAGVTGMNWALAGYGLTESAPPLARFLAVAAGFCLGSSLVLTFDRGFLYFADTAETVSKKAIVGYGALRILSVVAIGSLTAQYTVPFILGADLANQKQGMVQQFDLERREAYKQSLGLDGKQTSLDASTKEVAQLRADEHTLPKDLEARYANARACQTQLAIKRHAMRQQETPDAEINLSLAKEQARCSTMMSSSVAERQAYLARIRNQLTAAEKRQAEQSKSLSDASATFEKEATEGRQADSQNLGTNSQVVLWKLLFNNPAALMKWAVFSFVLLLCEMLPLLQKMQAGRSSIGRRIGAGRRRAMLQIDTQLREAEHKKLQVEAALEQKRTSIEEARKDPDLRKRWAKFYKNQFEALAMTEGIHETLSELGSRHKKVNDLANDHQGCQVDIQTAFDHIWVKAMQTLKA